MYNKINLYKKNKRNELIYNYNIDVNFKYYK